MLEPETIAVPVGTLRLLLARARAGETPRIAWQDSREAMVTAAMEARRSALQDIAEEIEALLPELAP
jgi:hypothetical protein